MHIYYEFLGRSSVRRWYVYVRKRVIALNPWWHACPECTEVWNDYDYALDPPCWVCNDVGAVRTPHLLWYRCNQWAWWTFGEYTAAYHEWVNGPAYKFEDQLMRARWDAREG